MTNDCPVFPSYDLIHSACIDYAPIVKECADLILGVERGGNIPATIIAYASSIPMDTINYSSLRGAGDNRQEHTNKIPKFDVERIAIVDEITDTGYTLKEIVEEYISRGHKVTTFVLHYKETSVFKPDYFKWTIPANGPWIIYPWNPE